MLQLKQQELVKREKDLQWFDGCIGLAMLYGASYKKAINRDAIKEELLNNAGKQFDPQIVKILLEIGYHS